jgi:Trk K+ transport system NAD-binding subunit/nucleotide-binding universal stress UspA family protein
MKPAVIIVGAGDTGAQLAERLSGDWEVTVVDPDVEALARDQLDGARLVRGDGSSALVLREAGAGEIKTLVAASPDDEVNLEVLKVARRDFGIENLFAVVHENGFEQRYEETEAQVVNRHLSCSALMASRLEHRKVATSIGLGEGEIMEVQVLANSSVIGRALADLSPRRWLVGAVYRAGELIVPHGDTVIEEGDRVVIIGDPEILSSIATHIGSGESEFPLHYGSKIVALDTPDLESLLPEAHYLLHATAASHLEVISGDGTPPSAELLRCCEDPKFTIEPITTDASGPMKLTEEAARRDVGVLLLPPDRLSLWASIGLARSKTVKFIDLLDAPALIARGSFPYDRVLLVMAELPFPNRAAQLAIDLVRMVDADLHLAVVHQPELVMGSQLREEVQERRRQVEQLAGLYHVNVRVEELEGNPIEAVVKHSAGFNVVVLPYKRRRRSSLTSPDVGQNLIHRVRCSTLVMPV